MTDKKRGFDNIPIDKLQMMVDIWRQIRITHQEYLNSVDEYWSQQNRIVPSTPENVDWEVMLTAPGGLETYTSQGLGFILLTPGPYSTYGFIPEYMTDIADELEDMQSKTPFLLPGVKTELMATLERLVVRPMGYDPDDEKKRTYRQVLNEQGVYNIWFTPTSAEHTVEADSYQRRVNTVLWCIINQAKRSLEGRT